MIVETLKWIAIAVIVGIVVVWLLINTLGGQPVRKDDDE